MAIGSQVHGRLSDSNNLPLPVLQYDEFAVNLLSRVPTDNVCRVDGIKLHLARFDKGTTEHHVEVRLLGQIDTMRRLRAANGDWPLSNAAAGELREQRLERG